MGSIGYMIEVSGKKPSMVTWKKLWSFFKSELEIKLQAGLRKKMMKSREFMQASEKIFTNYLDELDY